MPDLLLELFSEEIPARMQPRACADLKKLVTDGLSDAGLAYESAVAYATPRRLTLVVTGVPAKAEDVREERKGPRVGAPEKAVHGFLKGAGLATLDAAEIVKDDKKGDYYLAVIEKKGRAASEIVAETVPETIRKFPWPKSMRWGAGELRWVRPLHSILCLFGGKTVPFEIDGIKSGNATYGHRFMSTGKPIKVRGFDDYVEKLAEAHVVLDPAVRRQAILDGARKLAKKAKLELVEDEALLTEVAGLVEWPVPLIGRIDEQFMDVPGEVLTSTMRAHQKYLALRDPPFETPPSAAPQGEGKSKRPHPEEGASAPVSKDGSLAPRFIVVANLTAEDGGKAIVHGNERVLRARFADAKFLWEEDRKHTLESRVEKLKDVTFYEKLGSMHDKAIRNEQLASGVAQALGVADTSVVQNAAVLAKCDLISGMVYEFPDLQGVMGRYYALNDGLDPEIADAIAEHYSPVGPTDAVPRTQTGSIVALADKLDTLVGFFGIEEMPTGSRDPFALRRSALGVIRIVLEQNLRIRLMRLISMASSNYNAYLKLGIGDKTNKPLLSFFADRLKVHLRDEGARHDLVDAVFALEGQDDLVLIVKRVEALSDFLATEDGANLLAGYKRATNIIRIEEKKDKRAYDGEADPRLFAQDEERALFDRIEEARAAAEHALKDEDFAAAMTAIARLRAPVDTFFDKVTVNADDGKLRENRLLLLSQIRSALHQVADFSKIEG